MTTPTLPIECKLDVAGTTPDAAEQLSARLFSAAVAIRDLPDGYRIQLRDTPGILGLLAEFVEVDRRCCAFLRHAVVVDQGGGPIWLELSGGHGAKEAIAPDLFRLLPEGVRPC
jgi:hypothetical protein